MTKDNLQEPENRTGRTYGDVIYDFRFLIYILLIFVFIIFVLGYRNTQPGQYVKVFGIELFFKESTTILSDVQIVPKDISNADKPSSSTVKIISAKTIEELRNINGVSELEPLEVGVLLTELPNGIYGFEVPWMINSNPVGVVGGTGVEKINLSRTRGGTSEMEVHKSSDGTIYIVGYLPSSVMIQVQKQTRKDPIPIILFLGPATDRVPIAIPMQRIINSKNRHAEDNEGKHISVIDMLIS